jgi:hypothetical protein
MAGRHAMRKGGDGMTRDYDLTCRQIDNAAKELRDRIHNLERSLRTILRLIEEPSNDQVDSQKIHDIACAALSSSGPYQQRSHS